jgi:hypothetical protein
MRCQRTLWHAPDGQEATRARCGDRQAVLVTDDLALVTCSACRNLVATEEEERGC